VSVRAAVSSEVQSPLPGALVVGRIQFLVFVGMAFLFLAGSQSGTTLLKAPIGHP